MGQAIRTGYHEIFERNEYANNLTKDQVKGLVVEITGLASTDRVVQLICQTFEALKKIADFDTSLPVESVSKPEAPPPAVPGVDKIQTGDHRDDIDLNLSYTINLVLPKTDDTAVFSAIFRALRENLLRK